MSLSQASDETVGNKGRLYIAKTMMEVGAVGAEMACEKLRGGHEADSRSENQQYQLSTGSYWNVS